MTAKQTHEVWLVLPWTPDRQGGVTGVVQQLIRNWPSDEGIRPRLVVNDWYAPRVAHPEDVIQIRFALLIGNSFGAFVRSAVQAPLGIWRLWRLLTTYRVHAVNFHYTDQSPAGIALLKWLGLYRGRLVISYHGTDVRVPGSFVDRWLQRLCLSQADALVACAESLAERAASTFGLPRERLTVIRNGVDIRRFRPGAPTPQTMAGRVPARYLVSVGSFIPRKAPDVLIDAFAEVATAEPDLHLCIAGPDGPLRAQVQAQIHRLGLAHRVHLLIGLTPDEVAGLLAHAVLCVQPALAESMPLAVLEAGAVGVPMLVSNIPGHDEIVRPARTGYLFEPANAGDCARTIRQALAELGAARHMADELRDRIVADLTWGNCVGNYFQVFGISAANAP